MSGFKLNAVISYEVESTTNNGYMVTLYIVTCAPVHVYVGVRTSTIYV